MKTPKRRAAVRTSAKPERPAAPPVLVSVDLDAGPAKVARFAGLFFMFIGVCFATYSLSGMYVELVELSTSNHHARTTHLQRAQLISGTAPLTQLTAPQTEPVMDTSEQPKDPMLESNIDSSSGKDGSDDENVPKEDDESLATDSSVVKELSAPEPSIDQQLLRPAVEIAVSGGDPRRDVEEVRIRVPDAKQIEIVLVPKQTLTERYLGRAVRLSGDSWNFKFDTRNAPNGEYALFARITNAYGSYESRSVPVRIKNDLIQPRTEQQKPSASTTEPSPIDTEIANAAIEFKASEPPKDLGREIVPMLIQKHPHSQVPVPTPHVEPVSQANDDEAVDSDHDLADDGEVIPPQPPHIEQRAQEFVSSIDDELKEMLELYGVAIRGNDRGAIVQMEQRLSAFEEQITAKVSSTLVGEGMVSSTDDAQQVRDRIVGLVREERDRRAKEERLILDRVGDKIQRDSDRDGISDYDEERLYKTDPYVADSDRDGYTDGAEVLSGFDPANDARETIVAFEDPRESGTERADLLSVARLDVVEKEMPEATTSRAIALAGTALPNSFVTLYIFSTPVVVTVKTNDDGSWSYVFDKELEDGQHEVYVGVTDNAGKIVAKSKPFAFVKTAEAYSIGRIENQVVTAPAASPRLMSENALVLTTSLVVIMIGLVLVLIGAYLARRQRPAMLITPVLTS